MGVRIKGNKALLRKLRNVSKEGAELVKEEIFSTIHEIRNEAVSRVPVDTGFLKNSIIALPEGMSGKVRVNVLYGAYIEFGTGALVDVPQGLEDYAIQFKGKGVKQVNLPARPFLFPVWFKETKELIPRLEKGLAQIVKK